jgi:hypothetical protein
MNRRIGETVTRRPNEFLSRAKRALECGGLTPLFAARSQEVQINRKVRDREDALASTRDACATRKFRFNTLP